MKKKKLLLALLLATALIAGTAGAQDITTGLMGHWNLNDGSGPTALDSSPNGNDGTLVNDPVWVAGPPGFGGALDFDGLNDYVDCGTFVPTTDGKLSLCAWVYQEGQNKSTIVAKRTDWAGTTFNLVIRNTNSLFIVRSGAYCTFNEEVKVPVNEWAHVVVTVDGTENADSAKAYVNGEFIRADLWVYQCPVPDAPVLIGASQTDPIEMFKGLIDDVRIYNRVLIQADIDRILATDTAVNISPANGADPVAINTNLVWDEPATFTPSKYDLYYKEGDPNLAAGATVVTDIADTDPCNVYNPPADFAYSTTVYWRVDSYRPGASDPCVGDLWSFTTAPAEPVVTEDPCGVTVAAGDTAVFTVEDIGGTGYVWKRQSDNETVGGNSPVLTLTDVQKDPCEDSYYCIVSNAAGSAPPSAAAGLWTKRLIAHWEFEDNLDDSEADNWDGVYTDPNTANEPPTPVFVLDPCSIDGGKALQLTADELHVRITDSEDDFNFYPQGYTVNAWVKTGQADAYGAMASKQDRSGESSDWKGWILNCTDDNGKVINSLRQVAGAKGTTNVADDQWRMVTGTYDAETGVVAVYVDGKLETESAPISNVASTNAYPVVLGAGTVLGDTSAYEGLLDKMSIYSYALSPVDVAVFYTDIVGGKICMELPEHDFNGDCKVDLLDFAMFATKWLECNLVPTCY